MIFRLLRCGERRFVFESSFLLGPVPLQLVDTLLNHASAADREMNDLSFATEIPVIQKFARNFLVIIPETLLG